MSNAIPPKSTLSPQGVELFHRLTSLHHYCENQCICGLCPLDTVCVKSSLLPVGYPCNWTRGDRRVIVRRLLHEEPEA